MSAIQPLIPHPDRLNANLRALLARGVPPESLSRLSLSQTEPLLAVEVNQQAILCYRRGPQELIPLEGQPDPLQAARAWRDNQPDLAIPGGHFFLLGFGLSYYLQALLEKADEETLIWVIEPHPQAAAIALGLVDLSPVMRLPKLHWSLAESPEQFAQRMVRTESQARIGGQGVKILITPVAQALYPDEVGRYRAVTSRYVNQAKLVIESNVHQQAHSLEHLKNILPRLPQYRGIQSLWSVSAGLPAIIVGAGPSLGEEIERLKAVQRSVAIIAVDTAHRTLRRAGIQPDVVVCMDFTPLNARHLEEGPMGDEWLVVYPGVYPSILDRFPPERTLCMLNCAFNNRQVVARPLLRLLGLERTTGTVPTGGSTAHCAISLARMMGACPIYLLGVDLSFPGERKYTEGAIQLEIENLDTIGQERLEVPSNDGGMVLTNGMFHEYIAELGAIVHIQGIHAINLSFHGARLPGIPYRSFESIIPELSPTPIEAIRRIEQRIDRAVPVITVAELRASCVRIIQKLDDAVSEFSARKKQIKRLDAGHPSFRNQFKSLVGPIYVGAPKDDFLTMLVKYIEPSWAQFIGHGNNVGLLGGKTPEANRIAQDRFEQLLRDLIRSAKVFRDVLLTVKTQLPA